MSSYSENQSASKSESSDQTDSSSSKGILHFQWEENGKVFMETYVYDKTADTSELFKDSKCPYVNLSASCYK